MTFYDKLKKIVKKNNSLVCVGLDSNFNRLPERFKKEKYPQFAFNKEIIDKTFDLVCAYKPNSAFYEARGDKGIKELKMTIDYLKKVCPEVVTILDAKRADIGSTNKGYVEFIFDWLGFDAVTLHPYLGKEALEPFLQRRDKGCVILCRTSNPGAGEFQDLRVQDKPIWQIIAERVISEWNENNNCILVSGATYPEEMRIIRKLAKDSPLLVPGIGAQGGDLKEALAAGLNSKKEGMIINSSRAIIFSKDPKSETKKLKEEINKYR